MSGSAQRASVWPSWSQITASRSSVTPAVAMLHQGRMGAAEIDHAQRAEELLRGVGIVQPVANGGDVEAGGRRGCGHRVCEMIFQI